MSGAQAALTQLASELGPEAITHHDPIEVDGVGIPVTLRPEDGEALGRALKALGERGLCAVPFGSGTELGLGNPPLRADVLLSTERLAGVDVFDAGEGVCHSGAGTPLTELRSRLDESGWELPIDPRVPHATLGGAIATAAVGPRSLGYGRLRDVVLGLEVVLASGERTRCGGRVVKNVTGYDLNKLYAGSLGTLGVIEAAWLRLRARPESVRVFELPPGPLPESCVRGIAASRRATARACALLGGASLRGLIELAGDAPSVEQDASWLASELGAREREGAALDPLYGEDPATQLRFRLGVLPSALEAALTSLVAAGATLEAHPGLRLVYARFDLADGAEAGAEAGEAFRVVSEAARSTGGSYVCEWAPLGAKHGRDVFGVSPDVLPLMRALKQRFDPHAVLNPGRFAGGI